MQVLNQVLYVLSHPGHSHAGQSFGAGTMPSQIHQDQSMVFTEAFDITPKHLTAAAKSMQQNDGFALSIVLIVEDGSIISLKKVLLGVKNPVSSLFPYFTLKIPSVPR